MRLIAAFLKLVRLPNLLFIALAQVLFQVCIYKVLYKDAVPEHDLTGFILLVLASLLIAAAGYLINDYCDLPAYGVDDPRDLLFKAVARGCDRH